MKKLFFSLIALFLIAETNAQVAKKNWDLPSAVVKTLEGASIDTKDFDNDGKPMIISFWATWCRPCVEEMPILQRSLTSGPIALRFLSADTTFCQLAS